MNILRENDRAIFESEVQVSDRDKKDFRGLGYANARHITFHTSHFSQDFPANNSRLVEQITDITLQGNFRS